MNHNNNLEKRVEKTMESLDGLVPATASPYLYTKIRGRLSEDDSAWSIIAGKLSNPATAIVLAMVILLLNAWLLLSKPETGHESVQDQLSDLAYDYNFEPSAIAEQNNVQP